MILSKLKTCHVSSYLEKVFYLYKTMGGKLLAVSVKKKKTNLSLLLLSSTQETNESELSAEF